MQKHEYKRMIRREAQRDIGFKHGMNMSKNQWVNYAMWLEDKLYRYYKTP